MKKVVLLFMVSLVFCLNAYAIPSTISYQGVLTDTDGVALSGDYEMIFSLFDVETFGKPVWQEIQTVTVTAGVYSVQLGVSTSLEGVNFSDSYWLEVTVGEETLSPRQALTSVPYARVAAKVEQVDSSALPADISVSGTISGDGSGLTNLDWANLENVPAGFSDGVDDVVGSVDGLSGGQITGNVGINTSVNANYNLNIVGGMSDSHSAFFQNNDTYGYAYGLYSLATGSTSYSSGDYHYGVFGAADGARSNYGINGLANDPSALYNYGVKGTAFSASGQNYGVHGSVLGSATSTSYGVYGTASGTGNLWAGYFNGDTAVMGDLSIGSNIKLPEANLSILSDTDDPASAHYGIQSLVNGSLENYGVRASAADGTINTGVSASGFAGESSYGVKASASGGYKNYGVYAEARDDNYYEFDYLDYDNPANYNDNYGVYAYARKVTGPHPGDIEMKNHAIYSEASSDDTVDHNYGIYATANGGDMSYAIYGKAGDALRVGYAGYFEGDVTVTGQLRALSFYETSDRRLKENIQPLEGALEKLDAINGVSFNMIKSPDERRLGVIAQDVQPVLPEAVSMIDEEGHLGVSYTSLVPVLIEAVKELKAQNAALLERIEVLEGGGR